MSASIGILEFMNIAQAYDTLDKILKTYHLTVLKAQKICPGRFLILLSGNTADVLTMVKEYKNPKSKEDIKQNIKVSYSTGLSPATLDAIVKTKHQVSICNLAIIEIRHAVDAFFITDTIVKSFAVDILKLDLSLGLFGKALLYLNGSFSDLESLVQEYKNLYADKLVDIRLIATPHEELKKWI